MPINATIYTTCRWLPGAPKCAGLSWKIPILRDFTIEDLDVNRFIIYKS